MSIRITAAGRRQWPAIWTWRPHPEQRPAFDLWMVRTGRGRLETPSGTFPVATGDVFLLRPYTAYVGHADPHDPAAMLWIHFNWVDEHGQAQAPDPLPPLHRRVDDPRFFATLMVRCLRHFRSNPDSAGSILWLRAALDELDRHDRRLGDKQDSSLEAAIRDLAERIVQDPSLVSDVAACARRCHVSQRHFSRVFHACFGCAPMAWIIDQRIALAQLLLRDSDRPLKLIADDLGYKDRAFFGRQFKQRTGLSPAAYRQQQDRHPQADDARPGQPSTDGQPTTTARM